MFRLALSAIMLVLCGCSAREAKLMPPPAERIAALVDFAGPVALSLRILEKKDVERAGSLGIPLVAYLYSDRSRTSESITVAVYSRGAFRKSSRSELIEFLGKHSMPKLTGAPQFGFFSASGGRSIMQFPMGFGVGGSAYGALLPCRNSQFEIVLFMVSDSHDDEDPKRYSHYVSPRKELRQTIEAIEALVFQ